MAIESKIELVSNVSPHTICALGKTANLIARLRDAGDDGQSMIEIALVLPVFLLVVMGILTFGLTFANYIQVTEATSVGARTLAISRAETTDPCATAATAIYNAAPSLNHGNLSFSFLLNGVAYSGVTCSSSSNTTGAAGNLVQGKNATVIVTYPCSLKIYGTNFGPTCSLQSTMTEYVQ